MPSQLFPGFGGTTRPGSLTVALGSSASLHHLLRGFVVIYNCFSLGTVKTRQNSAILLCVATGLPTSQANASLVDALLAATAVTSSAVRIPGACAINRITIDDCTLTLALHSPQSLAAGARREGLTGRLRAATRSSWI